MLSEKAEKDSSIGRAACLARNVSTKTISLEMSPDDVVYEQSTPVLTSDGMYNAIKVVSVTEGTDVICKAKCNDDVYTANATLTGTILWYSCYLFLEAVSSSACYFFS